MANYTFADINDIVIRFVKVNTGTAELVTLVSNAVDIAFFEVSTEKRWAELLKVNQPLVMTGLPTPINLDANCLMVDRVKFSSPTATPPFRTWRLFDRKGMVPPAPIAGKPRAFALVQGSAGFPLAIVPEPYSGIIGTDTLVYDYYKSPELFSTTPDFVYSNLWDTEIIRRAINWVEIYMNKLEQANAILSESSNQSKSQPQSQPQQPIQ